MFGVFQILVLPSTIGIVVLSGAQRGFWLNETLGQNLVNRANKYIVVKFYKILKNSIIFKEKLFEILKNKKYCKNLKKDFEIKNIKNF